jgi:hypothetical protein
VWPLARCRGDVAGEPVPEPGPAPAPAAGPDPVALVGLSGAVVDMPPPVIESGRSPRGSQRCVGVEAAEPSTEVVASMKWWDDVARDDILNSRERWWPGGPAMGATTDGDSTPCAGAPTTSVTPPDPSGSEWMCAEPRRDRGRDDTAETVRGDEDDADR